jgi:antitoxin ParD1/3/4
VDTINISLSDALREFVEELVSQGHYGSTNEYLETLIREDRKRRERDRLEAMLLEGLSSGPMTEMAAGDWERIRQEIRDRLTERRDGVHDKETVQDR